MTAALKVDGPALREVTVRDYRRDLERAGVPIDMAEIERQALADCETFAAVSRDTSPRPPPAPDPEKEAEKAGALAREMAEKTGATVLNEPVRSVPIPLLAHANAPDSKWAAATSRCRDICRGANPLAYAHPGATTTEIMRAITSTSEIPALAMEYERVLAHWGLYIAFGNQAGSATLAALAEVNLFLGLSVTDAAAKYQRLVEDICDRSESKLGPWWTRGVTFRGRPV